MEATYMEEENLTSEENHHYLTFFSGRLTFALNTEHVVEIITSFSITAIPLVPGYIKGIINVRGQIIPVLDMRIRIGMTELERPETECIIILEYQDEQIGIMVDAVDQVIEFDPAVLSPVPVENHQELATSLYTSASGDVILLLNLDALMQ